MASFVCAQGSSGGGGGKLPHRQAPLMTHSTCLQEQMRLGDVRDVLRKTRHAGFPVVRELAQVCGCERECRVQGGVGGLPSR